MNLKYLVYLIHIKVLVSSRIQIFLNSTVRNLKKKHKTSFIETFATYIHKESRIMILDPNVMEVSFLRKSFDRGVSNGRENTTLDK